MRLAYRAYLDIIAEETTLMVDYVKRDLNTSAIQPTNQVLMNEQVHGIIAAAEDTAQFWIAQLFGGGEEVLSAGLATFHDEIDRRFETSTSELIELLERVGEDAPCWNETGDEMDAGFAARELALAYTLSRVELESLEKSPSRIDRELAVDGIDQRIEIHLRNFFRVDRALEEVGTLCLICADDEAAWVLDAGKKGLRWRKGRGPAEAALVGSAEALFLFCCGHENLRDLELSGDTQIAVSWAKIFAKQL